MLKNIFVHPLRARILGPALAGMLMASIGAIGCFAVNTASYLPFIGVALWILPRRNAAPTRLHSGRNAANDAAVPCYITA